MKAVARYRQWLVGSGQSFPCHSEASADGDESGSVYKQEVDGREPKGS